MIPYGKHHIDEEDIEAVVNVLRSGRITQGPVVEEFENSIADYTGAKYAVAVSTGTSALHLATKVAGISEGDALVTSPITFVASANAAHYNGGQALFSDIDSSTVNLSVEKLPDVLSSNKNVKALVPVHFAGLPCDIERIRSITGEDIRIIEDAAHALGANHNDNTKVGACQYSDMTIFSFHPVKAIASGEGGLITTIDEGMYQRLLRLRSHGINKLDDPFLYTEQSKTNGQQNQWYYEMQELGFNYRITDIQCALALSQLKKIDRFISRRRQLARQYDEAFRGLEFCRPAQKEGRDISAHHLYVLRIDFPALGITRPQFIDKLGEKDIGIQVHYIPVPAQPFYKQSGHDETHYPNAMAYYNECVSIPLFYDLTDAEQEHVIETIKNLVR